MKILVLSCGTGGGHNAAGKAIYEEMKHRGHTVRFEDIYELVGEKASERINNAYIKTVQYVPRLFGCIYSLGEQYQKLNINSPVYLLNSRFAEKLGEFLDKNKYDAIVASHMFASHMLKSLKDNGRNIPKNVLIATDYTCVPLMSESDCDLYVVPHKSLISEFVSRGIKKEKIKAFGIPVGNEFNSEISKFEARKEIGLKQSAFYFTIVGGSMGAGCIAQAVETLNKLSKHYNNVHIIVICGNNDSLYEKLKKEYESNDRITVLRKTDKMAFYMKSSDIFITKPGGLSSTEAAVANVPLIHISPIPGCETKNALFFKNHGLSIFANDSKELLIKAVKKIRNKEYASEMLKKQRKIINPFATADICDYIEQEL